ncbi:MAG: BatD family protein [Gammaproteobacteria bacterium]
MVKTFMPVSFLVVVLLLLGGLQQVSAEVQVSIDRNPVQVNESFQLVFSLDADPDRDPDFSALQQDFLILGNRRSSGISIINGEYQRSVKWGLKLMAKQVGEFTIPAIRFDHELSKPFQVTVKPSALASVPHDQLVLELVADKSEVFVQGQVILTLRLLSATDISAYQFGDISLENLDAVIEPMGDERQYQTRIADRSYLVLEQQFALFPQQSGRLGITPVRAEVRLPSKSSFDPFRTGGEIRQLRSQPLFVDVAPIPAEFTGPYWLPANKIELREEWQGDLTGLVAGEPVTRSLSLLADGLTAAQLPELELIPIGGMKQYPDQAELENRRSANGVTGQRVQKVALIPGTAGSYLVPAINLPWWNLQSGKMEIATIPSRELIVNAAAGVSVADAPVAEVQTTVQEAAPAAANPFWLWLSLALAGGWILSALYWWYQLRQPAAATAPSATEHPDLRQAGKQLQQACNDSDAISARRLLLTWGRALLAPRRISNLRQLGDVLGADLRHEIEVLNQSLYAPAGAQWRGQALWSLCQQLEKDTLQQRDQGSAGLLPLNPAP